MSGRAKRATVRIQVRCILCRRKWWLDPATVDEMGPFCDVCLMPATVERAKATGAKP